MVGKTGKKYNTYWGEEGWRLPTQSELIRIYENKHKIWGKGNDPWVRHEVWYNATGCPNNERWLFNGRPVIGIHGEQGCRATNESIGITVILVKGW